MATTRRRFRFKCELGHITEKFFMLGTDIDDYDETTCETCLKDLFVRPAYLIYVDTCSVAEQKHVREHS